MISDWEDFKKSVNPLDKKKKKVRPQIFERATYKNLPIKNENIFIPKGAIHRMANRKDRDLVIIEMWYGDNLDENDIKRYEDIYERI